MVLNIQIIIYVRIQIRRIGNLLIEFARYSILTSDVKSNLIVFKN